MNKKSNRSVSSINKPAPMQVSWNDKVSENSGHCKNNISNMDIAAVFDYSNIIAEQTEPSPKTSLT